MLRLHDKAVLSWPAITTEHNVMRQADKKANILLVDDRLENLLALEAILEPLGQNLVRTTSGAEALKQLLTNDFAVILLDVQMPVMDGFETATLIKEREKSRHIPIIFVTAISKDERYVFEGYSVGAVDYIRKPFDSDILRSKVAVLVDLFQKTEQIKEQAERLRCSEQREAERQQIERERALERRFLSELAESEARLSRFKATLDATHDGVFMCDAASLRFSYVNQGALQQLGYTHGEMLAMTTLDIKPEFDAPRFRQMITPLIEGKLASHTFETLHRRKDGQDIPVEISMQFIAPPGEDGHFISIARDITERKQAEEALAVAYERERKIAETLQRSLLLAPPKDAFPGLTVATFYEAAWKEAKVGGDFFDVFGLDEGRVALVGGDVSGKGLAAAARTAEVKFVLRAYLREDPHPGRALTRLNDYLCDAQRLDQQASETLVVVSLLVVNPATGEVVSSLAGAEPPLVLRAEGKAEPTEGGSLPLGVEPGERYPTATLCLAPGDTLLMVTDGITEARRGRGDFLGYEGMTKLAQQHVTAASLQEMGQAIMEEAQSFSGGTLQDDACLLLVRRR